jgi:hypothetical protein
VTLDDAAVRDRLAIQDVLARSFIALDRRDYDMLRNCFTADVRVRYGAKRTAEGIQADFEGVGITVLMERFQRPADAAGDRGRPLESWATTTHQMGTLMMTIRGDSAEAETYATAYLVDVGPTSSRIFVRGIRYLDRLRCTDGEWRICERVHTADWMFEPPLGFALRGDERVTSAQ